MLSDDMRNRIARYTLEKNIGLIDLTDAMRAKAESRLIHDPKNWRHFNAEGYAFLADLIDGQR